MKSSWGFFFVQVAFISVILFLIYLSQRFWFVRAWRLISRIGRPWLRWALRCLWASAALLILLSIVDGALAPRAGAVRIFVRGSSLKALVGLWLSAGLFAVMAVKLVHLAGWLWMRVRSHRVAALPHPALESAFAGVPDPSRRYFFQTASYVAGALPLVGALYGFAAERLRFGVDRVEVPIANLPPALDGVRIAQLSDIHVGGYMPVAQVRRAVEMANALGADLAVITGDFITGATDPLEDCIAELSRLRAPLGVWGCNGNHEIYADAEDTAADLFRRQGMRLLRHENAELVWRGQRLNLIGVDYQRERTPSGRRLPKLLGVERLVRRDAPNILLSHNPNAFPRAAELGIELTLAGHTHGGQVQVEILDRRWSPARFFTDFVAGLYQRPLGAPSVPALSGPLSPASSLNPLTSDLPPQASNLQHPTSSYLYVNRGLGTVGAPVRINVPPEITLLTLRRA